MMIIQKGNQYLQNIDLSRKRRPREVSERVARFIYCKVIYKLFTTRREIQKDLRSADTEMNNINLLDTPLGSNAFFDAEA